MAVGLSRRTGLRGSPAPKERGPPSPGRSQGRPARGCPASGPRHLAGPPRTSGRPSPAASGAAARPRPSPASRQARLPTARRSATCHCLQDKQRPDFPEPHNGPSVGARAHRGATLAGGLSRSLPTPGTPLRPPAPPRAQEFGAACCSLPWRWPPEEGSPRPPCGMASPRKARPEPLARREAWTRCLLHPHTGSSPQPGLRPDLGSNPGLPAPGPAPSS